MPKAITADQLVAQLKKWKVKYREFPGWRTRGRPGGLPNVVGIIEHHTGGSGQSQSYLNFLFVNGRPEDGIPGPLCQVATAADGTLHLGAVGRANHAGSGSATTLAKVRAENYNGYSADIKPGPDGTNGNPWYYGNEIMYTGKTAPTVAAYRTAVLHAAAVCDFHKWTGLSVIGHREHSRRKSDPGRVSMAKFRADVATCLRVGPGVTWTGTTPQAPKPAAPKPSAPPTKGTIVTATNDQIFQAVMNGRAEASDRYQDHKVQLNRMEATLGRIEDDTDDGVGAPANLLMAAGVSDEADVLTDDKDGVDETGEKATP